MSTISFSVSKQDRALIEQIVDRAVQSLGLDRLEISMDLTAVHANGCPLDLAGLLIAEPFDFGHDVMGINRYIDRNSGHLTRQFLPRFASRS